MRYNPAIFPLRYVRFPKDYFDQGRSLIKKNPLNELLNSKIGIPNSHIYHKRYFKVPEKIFISYCHEELEYYDAWTLLACYYLLDQKNSHVFLEKEILEVAWRNIGDFGVQLHYDKEFSFVLFRLLLDEWIDITEEETIILKQF
ncbi:hypothetical protein [Planococcus sp. NCCP-2050]|uniref:hypothetical protein n=1 Tax=Planococcus sp. NCCP-2050 TaxID=2944679 RepID=UPI00203F062B|nr:hypothetical protein [Planococcus sp. NCCP-2050]GKW47003.1 hypothetical protein NCCP2050_26950 [Planococcus sp. NCCP-2050]